MQIDKQINRQTRTESNRMTDRQEFHKLLNNASRCCRRVGWNCKLIFNIIVFTALTTTQTPTEATAAPTEATAAPTEATAAPTEATAAPSEATTTPSETTTTPIETTTTPIETTTTPPTSTTPGRFKYYFLYYTENNKNNDY